MKLTAKNIILLGDSVFDNAVYVQNGKSVIIRSALAESVAILDLRAICTEADDYSEISPIEPSCQGGKKIAEEIFRRLTGWAFGWYRHHFGARQKRMRIWAGINESPSLGFSH